MFEESKTKNRLVPEEVKAQCTVHSSAGNESVSKATEKLTEKSLKSAVTLVFCR